MIKFTNILNILIDLLKTKKLIIWAYKFKISADLTLCNEIDLEVSYDAIQFWFYKSFNKLIKNLNIFKIPIFLYCVADLYIRPSQILRTLKNLYLRKPEFRFNRSLIIKQIIIYYSIIARNSKTNFFSIQQKIRRFWQPLFLI